MRRTNSGVVTEDWVNLLTFVGLSKFADAPIIGLYSL
ncbi:MAG: hypothetical protein HWQ58_35095 [Nostoc sp. LPT]|nr:hypothetical protein [Nostoc sp. LPT]